MRVTRGLKWERTYQDDVDVVYEVHVAPLNSAFELHYRISLAHTLAWHHQVPNQRVLDHQERLQTPLLRLDERLGLKESIYR